MSDKTMVERLREGNNANATCAGAVIGALLNRDHTANCLGTECQNCINEMMKKLADAIEREYLERPRFENGEPVQEGDSFEYMDYSTGPMKRIQLKAMFDSPGGEWGVRLMPGERVKRPEPEVLDADGVPIRVGDHIWHKPGVHYDGIEYVVTRVTETRVSYRNAEGEFPRGNCLHEYASSNITHKQPDSLERIEGDALKAPRAYWGCYDTRCDFCPAKIDEGKKPYERYPGVTDCTSAQALDLLRRQREVLERDHER